MAYVSPSTRSVGTLVTAAIWNQDVVDNAKAGVPDIFTAAGQLAYATSADVAAALNIGSTGQKLTVVAGLPAWSNLNVPQGVRMTADQTFAATTTLANVTALVQAILANEVWLFEWYLAGSTDNTGGIKFAVTVPSGATLHAWGVWFQSAVVGQYGRTTTSGSAFAAGNTSGATTIVCQVWAGVVNGANAGNVQLQGAQNVASGNTTLAANSYQVGQRIA